MPIETLEKLRYLPFGFLLELLTDVTTVTSHGLGLESWPIGLWHTYEAELSVNTEGLEVVVEREIGGRCR